MAITLPQHLKCFGSVEKLGHALQSGEIRATIGGHVQWCCPPLDPKSGVDESRLQTWLDLLDTNEVTVMDGQPITPNKIQDLIDAAKSGDTIVVPAGIYTVDAVNAPIALKSGITLDLSATTLVATPNNQIFSIIMKINDCQNVTIIGGTIKGERNTHLGPTDASVGGGGGGIAIWRSNNIHIQSTWILDCFCDGLLVWHSGQIEIDYVIANRNRRQGMSIVDSHDVHVHDSQFVNSGGTPPGDGIDIENDLETEGCADILIERCTFRGNTGSGVGVGAPGQYKNIGIASNNTFDGKTQPIWVGGNAGSLGTPWWAFVLNRLYGWARSYRWWGYPHSWYSA